MSEEEVEALGMARLVAEAFAKATLAKVEELTRGLARISEERDRALSKVEDITKECVRLGAGVFEQRDEARRERDDALAKLEVARVECEKLRGERDAARAQLHDAGIRLMVCKADLDRAEKSVCHLSNELYKDPPPF